MLTLEEILCYEGLGKVFYHEYCEDVKFHVIYDSVIEDYVLLAHDKDDMVMVNVVGGLLDGFFTKE